MLERGDVQSLLSQEDIYLFNEGTHRSLYQKLGAHPAPSGGGVFFAVWAPNASAVFVTGDFNSWSRTRHPLFSRGSSGLWEGLISEAKEGSLYKYRIVSTDYSFDAEKADPVGFYFETSPKSASIVRGLSYEWKDKNWMASRPKVNSLEAPISIYELHLGSWRRVPEENNRSLSYREMAPILSDYLRRMNFTHVEILPVMEHPFYGSWGYQTLGYFAPTSRYGTPQDFMFLIDTLHQNGIGVILDWVPSHFATDGHGLGLFDGTHLYEHSDPKRGFHPDWGSYVFNYNRHEVRSFLLSSAMFWLKVYHADALRVDAVASMLYLDYSRKEGDWVPNKYGGCEDLEAISLLRSLNEAAYLDHAGVQTFAEESTSWPMVSRPTSIGGLGFGFKWDMGWMHDSLHYFQKDPIHRKYHHNSLTFRMLYAWHENFVLPLSHDEVVHGKGSLIGQMAGDVWQKFANLRLLLADLYAQPGKKLIFMGGELGQWDEWNHDKSLDWHLLGVKEHEGIRLWVQMLNKIYRDEPALHENDCSPHGFEWIDCADATASVLSWRRKSRNGDSVIVILNLTPIPRPNYRIGVPKSGYWKELLNSDSLDYGGSGLGNFGGLSAENIPFHNQPHSINLTLPPLAALFLKAP
jgi:1,4-alpha-glucan branching enzyme